MTSQKKTCWIVVPAAGIGSRMGAVCPKQYLPLAGKTVLENTLERLLKLPDIAGIVLVLHAEDHHWNTMSLAQNPKIHKIIGGDERCNSVLNALDFLARKAASDDWVLVHDAARPCVSLDSIIELVDVVQQHSVGGILGVPVSDTLKQVEGGSIQSTANRNLLWHAQTPQMFRLGLLKTCLQRALSEGKVITDESSAVECYGYHPLMVQGRSDNIKITRPEDLAIAAMLIQQQLSN
ncbi:2-C-methyl-D-erythritol 4-phosphate cytidylyltransferase [Cellvibrio sp. UBA7661]|uniref:2-C-methyl-D-erythritol 4-phosphate cytidylyltransferase n=1 Tax=Cellvibrio sp. UBA7661 TaxID=1946311 RepID=UPI002F35AC7D